MEDPRRIGPHAHGDEHEAELADRGVGEHLLDVVLGKADGGGKKGCENADDGDHIQGVRRHAEQDVQPGDHVHAGRHHRRRVDQRADRGGAFHRVGQPDIEGDLRRLADGAYEEQERNDGDDGNAQEVGVFAHFPDIQGPDALGAQADKEEKDADQESEISHPVDDEGLLPRVRGGILFIPEPDQQVGAEAHPFPSHEQEQQAVSRHQKEHHEDEEVQVDEEPLEPRIAVHVAHGIYMDEKAHPRHHQTHDDRKGVETKADVDAHLARGDPVVDIPLEHPGRRRQLEKLDKDRRRAEKGRKQGKTGHPGNKSL